MSISCKQCGAALTERDAFCTKCGAGREDSAGPTAARRFCTKCGATLAAETKFCTKCGAVVGASIGAAAPAGISRSMAAGASAASSGVAGKAALQTAVKGAAATPAAKSPGGIPKIALIAGGIVVLVVIVAVVAGVISAARHAREKAQEREAAQNFEKSLANLASSGKSGTQNGNSPSAADINKSLNELTAAANAIAQNAQKQGGANPLNAIPGTAGAGSGSTSTATSSSSSASPPGPSAAIAAADTALIPPPLPKPAPIVPVAATGNQAKDWALEYERTVGGPEADLVVRTGDINNLGFGWPAGFDPFSGKSTPPHPWPNINQIPAQAPPGTDRIMVGTSAMPVHMIVQQTAGHPDQIMLESITHTDGGDGYSGTSLGDCYNIREGALQQMPNVLGDPVRRALTEKFVLRNLPDSIRDLAPSSLQNRLPTYFLVEPESAARCTRDRALTMPTAIVLPVGQLPSEINNIVVQIFADDFQPVPLHSRFQVSLNGTRIPTFEYAINSLDQTGPIGKLLTLKLLPEYWPIVKSGTVKLLIDDPTTRVQDGYAVDFVRILVNPHSFKYQVALTATVTDADTHKPIGGAMVTAGLTSTATDRQGKCELKGLPAGLVIATANAPGYDENSVPVDLSAGQSGHADIQLHQHQESTAALEQSIAQTGTATIYGIHFDTGSSKLRADSLPALQAVLGLINGRPGSNWIIAGHTDNQGSDRLNIPLSKARAASVVSWLTAHGVAANRLEPQGFGATRPVADNATANGRFLNRRVEIALAK
ncbi:MAG: OmpA family protein [Candidatus Acidiferrales bacterium]